MEPTVSQLRAMSDAEIVATHDQMAKNVVVGTKYYLDELQRRDIMAALRASEQLASRSLLVARTGVVVAVFGVIIAIAAMLTALLS